ncbi:alpha/beta fold hydrolase [Halorubellus sp. PRR65]|uniref:alpha/beta fold hydrolase n=1 Tax=Halorubellus sp. PRR65 TaxID=3098148 RepID=UPI002B2613B0|nr:alpha/beta fold hydrolase [Halorubellus sp. PRR65]
MLERVQSSFVDAVRERVPSWSRRQWVGVVVAGVLAVLVLAAVGFWVYFGVLGFQAPAAVTESVRANPDVNVERAYGGFVVRPTGELDEATRTTGDGLGVVFYPGGRVAPDAYLSSAARVVEETGATVFVPRMTANLAVLSQGKANAIIEGEGEVETWVVGGHSLGGAMACRYANANPDRVDGLLLVGAYCDRPVERIPALSVVGTRDAVLDRDRFRETTGNLPANASVVRIDGMNHSQAGWYYGQAGGQPATVTYPTAHDRLAAAVDAWVCAEYDRCSSAGAANATSRTSVPRSSPAVVDSAVVGDSPVVVGSSVVGDSPVVVGSSVLGAVNSVDGVAPPSRASTSLSQSIWAVSAAGAVQTMVRGASAETVPV